MSARTLTRIATTLGALALLAGVLATSAVGSDGRATDTKDHAYIRALLDGRSPDTIDATKQARATPVTDLRSPDTRDGVFAAPTNTATPVTRAEVSGFDWIDAGIGATSGFAIAILAAGALLLIRRSNGRRLAV